MIFVSDELLKEFGIEGTKKIIFDFLEIKKINPEIGINVHGDDLSFELIDGHQFNLLAEAKPGYYILDLESRTFKISIN
ncbi:MAG: hypothetical protein LKF69_05155 [Bacilli bacterium]|jgi:ABC-type enterochelin transport system substrate-binding protein|nr:hypothetical protein [Bacilli bacterium]MCH4236165.1 hypothetical protein [Bacilli bacterium]